MAYSERRDAELKKQVGMNLRRLRLRRGLNQVDVSNAVGISQAQISKLENGTMGLGLIEAKAVAKFFGCAIDDLLAASDPRI